MIWASCSLASRSSLAFFSSPETGSLCLTFASCAFSNTKKGTVEVKESVGELEEGSEIQSAAVGFFFFTRCPLSNSLRTPPRPGGAIQRADQFLRDQQATAGRLSSAPIHPLFLLPSLAGGL